MLTTIAIRGYRSLRDVRLELAPLSVITGANGSGKSSLYRALRLLADVAQGRVVQSLAVEGGLSSVLWAGPEQLTAAMRRGDHPVQGTGKRIKPVSLMLGFATDDLGYLIEAGLAAEYGVARVLVANVVGDASPYLTPVAAEAIAHAVSEWQPGVGYVVTVDEAGFWAAVEKAAVR